MEMEVQRVAFTKIRDMLSHKNQHANTEFECRYNQFISKDQFSKVMAYLRSQQPPLKEMIHDETLDIFARSHRITITSKPTIQKYCATNILTEKEVSTVITKRQIKGFTPVFMNSINFKVDLKEELPVRDMIGDLSSEPKMFRFKKRFSFTDNKLGIRYDLTISKTSTSNNHKNFAESGTLNAVEKYEFEIESIKTTEDPYNIISKMIEMYMVITDSGSIGQSPKVKPIDVYRKPKRFMVGPQPVSIERKNIVAPPKLGAINIIDGDAYTVTEKTDGERYLLFVDSAGHIFMINSRFELVPTGVTSQNFKSSLLDGEWVESIKMYALFDAYFINDTDIRALPLVKPGTSAPSKSASASASATSYKSRLEAVKEFHKRTAAAFADASITLHMKAFLHGDNILELSKQILDRQAKNEFPYHIDGLIYTPAYLPLGGSFKDDVVESSGTWSQLVKWKPPEENTIDFLVKYERDSKGKPQMIAKDGQLYHVCGLYVGFQPSQWEKITALQALTAKTAGAAPPPGYMARRFIPPDAVEGEAFATHYSKVEGGLEDDSIVEFAFDNSKREWSMLRVRTDKTEYFRKNGLSSTANDYSVALNIWRSIQNPVTRAMITGVQPVTEADLPDDNVYYSRNTTRDKFASRPMMDFHNHWVKSHTLIAPLKADRLLDLACGKGGDLNKWVKSGTRDVVGFDYVVDNIENPIDGVYARMSSVELPKNARYVFLPMDCSKLLKPTAAYNERDREVARVLWGEGLIDNNTPLSKYWNMMRDFDVVSCQFAIHYFFESPGTLGAFLTNVDAHIKTGGCFIGTCLDGSRVKAALAPLAEGEHLQGRKNGRVIWDITKKYKKDDVLELGDAVDIYMESIGRVATEYLVDMRLLESRLKDMGYETVFVKHFDHIHRDVSHNATGVYADSVRNMTEDEKRYSFMNCAFCFRKVGVPTKPAKAKISIKKKIVTEPEAVAPEPEPVPVQAAPAPKKKIVVVKKTT